jgi:hypothetical protein
MCSSVCVCVCIYIYIYIYTYKCVRVCEFFRSMHVFAGHFGHMCWSNTIHISINIRIHVCACKNPRFDKRVSGCHFTSAYSHHVSVCDMLSHAMCSLLLSLSLSLPRCLPLSLSLSFLLNSAPFGTLAPVLSEAV